MKYDKSLFEEKNFIITDNSIERIKKISYYISRGIPVLLEGPSGTSKTFSTEFACLFAKTKKPLKRFNLSSDTTTADLLGKIVGDKNSLAGVSSKKGIFLIAFSEGYPLLLDEINLASPIVLQCIEEALDSGIISVEISGFPLKQYKRNPDFCLIATQNPNKGLFENKRQNLGKKFMSKFQVITFPEFSENELKAIAIGLGKNFGFKDKTIIEHLVEFHRKWTNYKEIKDDVQCFTIREIAACVKAFSEKENLIDTVMTIYGARYTKKLREKLNKLLTSYNSFKNIKPNRLVKPDNFPNCFINDSLLTAIKSIKFSIDNNRSVIISGEEDNGKTQLALWFGEWYIKEKNLDKSNIFYCLCTDELKCQDLIGKQIPTNCSETGEELISWKNGFLSNAIEKGGIVILDALDQAPSTVTERINGLLDKKYDKTENIKFDIPENPQKVSINIHPNFRLICITEISKINLMSPSLLNRFDVIVLENQLENLDREKKKELIKHLLINSYKEQKVNEIKTNQINNEKTELIEIINQSSFSNEKELTLDLSKIQDYNENEGGNEEENEDGEFDEEYNILENKGIEEEDEKYEEPINVYDNKQNINDNLNINNKNENKKIENIDNNINHKYINIEYEPDTEIIELIYDKFNNFKSIYKLNQFCRIIKIFLIYFKDEQIKRESIVNFCFNILTNNFVKGKLFDIDKDIKDILLKLNDEPLSDDSQYFYKNSEILRNYIAFVHACKIANIHLCIYGPPGVGKTSGIRSFGRIISKNPQKRFDFEMHSFHAGTKPIHYYGSTTLQDGKIIYKEGSLTNALINGYIFIADELNLSSEYNIKALAPSLENIPGQSIYFAGIDKPIKIHPDFFFVICQNEVGNIGRNELPSNISRRFIEILYPAQDLKDITQICKDINNSLYKNNEHKIIEDNQAEKLGEFMIELNKLNNSEIPQWSLKDINKLFHRQIKQEKMPGVYKGISFCHNILFYILSSVNKIEIPNIKDTIINMIQKIFNLSINQRNNLYECFNEKAKLENYDGNIYIVKGQCRISFDCFSSRFTTQENQNIEDNPIMKLNSLLEDFFQILLSYDKEPILLIGPSGYKTFLAEKFLDNAKTITLNQESSIEQLLGNSSFFTKTEVKEFYLRLFVLISKYNNFPELSEKLKKGILTKEEINTIYSKKKNTYTKIFPLCYRKLY